MFLHSLTRFAAPYNCNTYGAGSYDNGGACSTQTTSPVDTALSYTGEPMFLIATAAVLIVIVAAAVLVINSRRKKK